MAAACAPKCWMPGIPGRGRAEPAPGIGGRAPVPDDAVIYPPCAARFLLERAHVDRLRREAACRMTGGGIQVRQRRRRGGGSERERHGRVGAGAHAGIAVRKRKGHLVITDRYPGFVRHQLMELGYLKSAHSTTADSVAFNVQPRRTGQVLIGSSRQFGAEDSGIDTHMLQRMLQRAVEYMPGSGGADGHPHVDGIPRGHAG